MFEKVLNQFDFGDDLDVLPKNQDSEIPSRSAKFVLSHNGYGLLVQQNKDMIGSDDSSVHVTVGYVSFSPLSDERMLPQFNEDLNLGRELFGTPCGVLRFANKKEVKRVIGCLAKRTPHHQWSRQAFASSSAVEHVSAIRLPVCRKQRTASGASLASGPA